MNTTIKEKIKAGMTAYTATGEAVSVDDVLSGGFLVRHIYESHDENHGSEEFHGDLVFYNRLYIGPPLKRYHEKVKSLQDDIERLKAERDKENDIASIVQGDISKLMSDQKHVEALASKVAQENEFLTDILHFMRNGVWGVVKIGQHDKVPVIMTSGELIEMNYDFRRVFNLSISDFFDLNKIGVKFNYRDRKGNPVIFCKSESDAKEKLKKHLSDYLNTNGPSSSVEIIDLCDLHGVDVSDDIRKAVNEGRIDQLKSIVANREKEMATWDARAKEARQELLGYQVKTKGGASV